MPARPKSPPQPPQTPDSPTFEDALAGLEAVVNSMEQGTLPLEDLVARYEEGTALLRRCETILAGARERIELITARANAAAAESAARSPETDAENDGADAGDFADFADSADADGPDEERNEHFRLH